MVSLSEKMNIQFPFSPSRGNPVDMAVQQNVKPKQGGHILAKMKFPMFSLCYFYAKTNN